ncbi:hypothetical protein LCGC14_0599850 [marine sediment metagenome]|uniref:Uncharacterized protein n=1 Tax=marine sediment metagenome TaxID=412755 RepID=A0A0F9RUR8_9ZZZZ|nr:hypothetical protein [archaeon]
MPKEIKGIILSRLIVLISIILVPIAIFLIYNLADFDLWFSSDPIITFVIIKILSPLVFSISWLFFLILFINRFASTIDNFDKLVSVVPSRLKFFYGLNAIIILFIFVFPIITPIISILSFASFAWRLTTFKKEAWDDDSEVKFITKFMMVLASIIPIFCTISVIPQFIVLASFLWNDIWLPLLPSILGISYSLFTALAIGALVILFYNSGISEYEQFYAEPSKKQRLWNVKLLELVLFIFFLTLDIFKFDVIYFFYMAGFVIIIFTSIINFLQGKSKIKNFKSHFLGYLIAAVFIGSNVLFSPIASEFADILSALSLIISAILYIFVFFYTFIRLEEI